jgi:AraC-like DNA-binding protein
LKVVEGFPISFVLSLNAWREEVGRHLLRLDFEPSHDESFRAIVEPLLMRGALRVTRCTLGRGRVSRGAHLAKCGEPSHTLLIANRRLSITHRGQDVTLQQGDATVLKDFEPGEVAGGQGVHFAALTLANDGSELWCGFDCLASGWRMPAHHPALELLRGYLGLLSRRRLDGFQSDLAFVVERQLLDLAQLAIEPGNAPMRTEEEAPSSVKLAQILILIERNFRNPSLNPEMVAGKVGVSRRYLFRLLKGSGASFTERILAARLGAAHAELVGQDGGSNRIGEVALTVGFSDISYFNRCFRERYGLSPSEARDAR